MSLLLFRLQIINPRFLQICKLYYFFWVSIEVLCLNNIINESNDDLETRVDSAVVL